MDEFGVGVGTNQWMRNVPSSKFPVGRVNSIGLALDTPNQMYIKGCFMFSHKVVTDNLSFQVIIHCGQVCQPSELLRPPKGAASGVVLCLESSKPKALASPVCSFLGLLIAGAPGLGQA